MLIHHLANRLVSPMQPRIEDTGNGLTLISENNTAFNLASSEATLEYHLRDFNVGETGLTFPR